MSSVLAGMAMRRTASKVSVVLVTTPEGEKDDKVVPWPCSLSIRGSGQQCSLSPRNDQRPR